MWIFKFKFGPSSVNMLLCKKFSFFFCLVHAFRLPHLRFSSNRRQVSRSLHSRFSPSYRLAHFYCWFYSNSYSCLKRKKKKKIVWPSFLPRSFFIVFLLQPYSEFMLSIFSSLSRSWPLRLLLQAVESLQQRLYGLININERSIRTCLCAEPFFCLWMHVNLNGCGNTYTSQPLCLRLMGFIFLKLRVSKFLISWTTLRPWIKEIRRGSCKQHHSIELLWWHYRNWYLLNTFDAIYQHINRITLIPCTNELICIIKLLCLFCLHFLLICMPARRFSLCHIC